MAHEQRSTARADGPDRAELSAYGFDDISLSEGRFTARRDAVRVGRPMAFDIEAWSDYGVAIVGAAAALAGLLFVAVSVNSAWFSSSDAHRGRAGQALVLFVVRW